MSGRDDRSIRTGNISGTGIAVGHGARASVTITQAGREEISKLLEQLKCDIAIAEIPDGAKRVLQEKAVPEMADALREPDPKSGVQRGIERINDHLESVGAVTTKVSGIVETVVQIAKTAGIAIKTVAPFLAGLL
jgi:hypothetical protein